MGGRRRTFSEWVMMRTGLLRSTIDAAVLVLAAVAAWKFLDPPTPRPVAERPESLLQVGERLEKVDVTWRPGGRHVVILIGTRCRASDTAAPVFARIAREASANGGPGVVVLSADPESDTKAWLRERRIEAEQFVRVPDPAGLGFLMTPTLLIVDDRGTITDFWSGLLPDAKNPALAGRLEMPPRGEPLTNAMYATEVDADAFDRLIATGAQLLDIREREFFREGHRARARNIPLDELKHRAPVELNDQGPVALSCEGIATTTCRSAGRLLRGAGFTHVVILRN